MNKENLKILNALKIPIAILIGALMISSALIYNNLNDPMTRCIERLLDNNQMRGSKKIKQATLICNRTSR